jgi:large subunit ribosomal protein L31e
MADKPKEKKKKKGKAEIKLERVYNVPLRKQWLKAPLYKRAKKAAKTLREFLAKHMKTDVEKVKIGKYANLKIWERGIRFPPHHIKVTAKKDEEGNVFAEIEGAPAEKKEEKKPAKKEATAKKIGEVKEKLEKIREKPEEKPKEEKKPEEKPAEKPKEEAPKPVEKKPKE